MELPDRCRFFLTERGGRAWLACEKTQKSKVNDFITPEEQASNSRAAVVEAV